MKLNCFLATILGTWLASTSMTTLAGTIAEENITAGEWALLPPYCPHTMAFKGYQANKGKWEVVMGKGFAHMHHYCWALVRFHRAEKATVPTTQKQYLRKDALDDFGYVVRNTDDDFILLPEILTWVGRTLILLGRPVDADKSFAKARTIKPDYWPAYTYWADFLLRNGHKADALELVKVGLQHAPRAKVLHELFRSSGGKPGDIPPPIAENVPPSVTEKPNPGRPEDPPVTETEAKSQ